MARKKTIRQNDDCVLDMTPMIDVVFQLIIFFVVTLKSSQTFNEDIQLEWGKNGPKIEEHTMPPTVIEIDSRGWIYIQGGSYSPGQLNTLLRNRVNQRGPNFPLLIRADRRAQHKDIKKVMDICTAAGLWKLSFVAMIKPAT